MNGTSYRQDRQFPVARRVSTSCASGTSRQPVATCPISTEISPPPRARPAAAGIGLDADLVATVALHHQIGDTAWPLPQAAECEPSWFRMSGGYRQYRSRGSPDRSPIPSRRSAPRRRRHTNGSRPLMRQSKMMKSFPAAVHFQKLRHGQPIRQIPTNEKWARLEVITVGIRSEGLSAPRSALMATSLTDAARSRLVQT